MPMHPFHRTELLIGGSGFEQMRDSRVCVIGLGGVGSYAAEALVRSGVGHLTLVDFDDVCITNLNRQLPAVRSTVGKKKAALMGDRAKDINPKADVVVMERFYNRDSADAILDGGFDYVLDCIDNMTAKIHLIGRCVRSEQPLLSAMGAGGRMDPTRIRVSDISATHSDPFARIVRDCLKDLGILRGVECVWSEELPNALDKKAQDEFRCICPNRSENDMHSCERRLQVQGSVAWMPSIFGMTMAGVVVNRMLERPIWDVDVKKPHHRQRPAPGKPSRARKQELMREAGIHRESEAEVSDTSMT